jgi:hypothetical protein
MVSYDYLELVIIQFLPIKSMGNREDYVWLNRHRRKCVLESSPSCRQKESINGKRQ